VSYEAKKKKKKKKKGVKAGEEEDEEAKKKKTKNSELQTVLIFFFLFLPAETHRYSANTARVGPIWAVSARVGESTWQDAQSVASLPHRRVPPSRTRVRLLWSRVRAFQGDSENRSVHPTSNYNLL